MSPDTNPITSPFTATVLEMPISALGSAVWRAPANELPFQTVMTPANVILGGTRARVPAFREQMFATAEATGSHVIVARHGLNLRPFKPVSWDVVARWNGELMYREDYLLCLSQTDQVWLMPTAGGAYIELDHDGLTLYSAPPFVAAAEAANGILIANTLIANNTRGILA